MANWGNEARFSSQSQVVVKSRETSDTTSVFISESELPKTKYPDNPELGELSFFVCLFVCLFFSFFFSSAVSSLGFVVKVPLQHHAVFRFRIGEENVGTARKVRYCIVLVKRVCLGKVRD